MIFVGSARFVAHDTAGSFCWPRLRRLTLTYTVACLAAGEVVVTALCAEKEATVIGLLPGTDACHAQSGAVVRAMTPIRGFELIDENGALATHKTVIFVGLASSHNVPPTRPLF